MTTPNLVTRQNAQDSQHVVRVDSVGARYERVGVTGTVRKYTVQLLQTTEDGEYENCKQLLEKGADVNEIDEETGFTALHIAIKNDNFDILRLLLDKEANCNAQDKTKQTPLQLAVKKNHITCSQILLDCAELSIKQCNKTNDTALHYAAKEGRYEICKMILKRKDVNVNVKNKKGMTPLHYAAEEDQYSILQLLLDNMADSAKQDNSLFLALHYAAQKGYKDCCRVLISNLSTEDKQKQLKIHSMDGKTPLMLAAKGGYHICCEIMEFGNINAKDKAGNTALHFAVLGGYDCSVTELLNNGADPDVQNEKGSAPVLEAAGKKKFGCLKILVEKGANLNVYDKQRKNVLHYAAEKDALEILSVILSFSGIITIIDNKDITQCSPLHLAIKRDADDCALLLLKKGASPVQECLGGMTPLHLAAVKGSTSICEFLLSKKEVQVSQENESKATPLHMASLHGSTAVCQMLIRKGARLTAVDDKGRTAVHVASAEGYANVVKFLSKKSIPLKVRDDTGSSALHLSASKGSLECCQVLVSCAKATCWEMDQNRDLPLDRAFAEKNGSTLSPEALEEHDQVFKYLLKCLCFKPNQDDLSLRIHQYMDTALKEKRITIIEAIIDSCWWRSGLTAENDHKCRNFRQLIEDYPSIAHKLQDKCITHSKETGSKVTYDFALLEDNYYVPSGFIDKLAKSPFDPKTHKVLPNAMAFTEDGLRWKNDHPVAFMILHKRSQLLHHPLVEKWLWRKWSSYIYIIFLILVVIEILFAGFLAFFMEITDNWSHVQNKCNLTKEEFCNATELLTSRSSYFESSMNNITANGTGNEEDIIQLEECHGDITWKRISWAALLTMVSITFLMEFNYMWRLKKEYIRHPGHVLQLTRTILTVIILFPVGGACEFHNMILNVEIWQCGIGALLLTSLHLVNTLNQLPALSIFMPVTVRFAKSFFKVIFYLIMILFVFAFIFHLLLKDQIAFSTVPQAMVKTIVWMLGDLAYDDTFLADDHILPYPVMVNFLFVIFVTFLGGFIANLIITQPSNHLDSYRDKASFHGAASRSRLFLKLDICFPFFRKRRTVGSYVDDESNGTDCSFLTTLAMLDMKKEIKPTEDINPMQLQLEELNRQFIAFMAQHSDQREEIRDLKYQIKSLLQQNQS